MKAPNHVAGGIVFTGIFCSFWNVNIFSTPGLIGLTVFASLLPDIDHTRSILGKAFYPLSRWLDRHYGHRTVTHSLTFFILSALVAKIIEVVFEIEHLYLVYVFALASHLIFDMLTKQGIPLFYPFYRNPCVIGSNPDLRLTGSGGGEMVVFSLFLVMLYFCLPLFQNGFWMSYNKNFSTLQHLHSTALMSDNLLRVDYEISNNFRQEKGQGLLLFHEADKAILLDDGELIEITGKDKIHALTPEKTTYRKELKSFSYQNIAADSLKMFHDKIIVSGVVSSSDPFQIRTGQGIETTQKAKLEWVNHFEVLPQLKDTTELVKKRLEIDYAQKMLSIERKHLQDMQQEEQRMKASLETELSDYQREVMTVKLKEVSKEIERQKPDDSQVRKLQSEYEQIKLQLGKEQWFDVQLTVLEVI